MEGVRGLDISQVSSSQGTTPSIVIWPYTIYYTIDQPFTWRSGKTFVRFLRVLVVMWEGGVRVVKGGGIGIISSN